MGYFILLLQYFNHIRLFLWGLMVLSAGTNYQYPELPVPEHKNTFQSAPLSSLTVTYRWAVEYSYLLQRSVSTGSNKQATANTQITAWVSLWLTLLTSWFVFTLLLKNYRKMWNMFSQKQFSCLLECYCDQQQLSVNASFKSSQLIGLKIKPHWTSQR